MPARNAEIFTSLEGRLVPITSMGVFEIRGLIDPLTLPGEKAPSGFHDNRRLLELIPGIHAETPPTSMRVRKRNGSFELVLVDKIIRAVERCSWGW